MSANRDLLIRVARKIRPLLDELVFVGGAVVELYFTSPASPRVRPTADADAICQVTGYARYDRLGERLRTLGFSQRSDAADPPYRWRSSGDVLDLMPTDPQVLGFTNRWYERAIKTATPYELERGLFILLAPPPVFLATKLAAHESRGRHDPLTSVDLEDAVALLANRPELVAEIAEADPSLRDWISDRVSTFFRAGARRELVASFLPEVRLVPDLVDEVEDRLGKIGHQRHGQ